MLMYWLTLPMHWLTLLQPENLDSAALGDNTTPVATTEGTSATHWLPYRLTFTVRR
ncbi:hypothetical protein WKK05_30695 [Nostoc sp. UHCC 0302]|uniref:hypothetical protein n=1 Tax=Nostoc sp. UHCC 0302 TaxID=3134896 RepID=UPI00311C8E21